MAKTISAWEARRQFGKLLRDVSSGKSVVVESHGEEVAAVVPIEQFRQWEHNKEAFFDKLESMAKRSNLSEEEADALAAEAVAAIRGQL